MKLLKNPAFWFFALFFISGMMLFTDYGLGWDDQWSRIDTGYNNYNYVFKCEKDALLQSNEKYHGPFFEMFLVAAEKAFYLKDSSDVYRLRHFILFTTFFLSVIAFYQIALKLFDKNLALLACIFLVLSPRIFGESFYNSKDVLFLSFFNFTLFSYSNFMEKRNLKWALIHALFTGLLIDIRILGILFPLLTFPYFVLMQWLENKNIKSYFPVLAYLTLSIIVTILFWPILWEGPWKHFTNAYVEMKKYHWNANVFYWGQSINAGSLPWHYLPIWIFITTPILYSLLFLIGVLAWVKQILTTQPLKTVKSYLLNTIAILFVTPIFSVIFLHSVVYDGWRHIFFVYPMLIIISIYGLSFLIDSYRKYATSKKIIYVVVAMNCLATLYWMAKNHPHENVYFNYFAKTEMNAGQKFELDYWGLSYKQAYEYLLENEKTKLPLNIGSANLPGKLNYLILSNNDKTKINIIHDNDDSWDYFLTNYRGIGAPDNTILMHQIKVDNIPIMGIYKKR